MQVWHGLRNSSKIWRLEGLSNLKWNPVYGIWYREEMVLLFHVDDDLMFSPSKEKIMMYMRLFRHISI